jgi:hypothetical protein
VNGGLADLLSPGQPGAGASAKRCPDALSAATLPRGSAEVPGQRDKRWLAVGPSRGVPVACPAHRLLSRGGGGSRREHVKGPCSRKVSRFASRRLPFTGRRWRRAWPSPSFRAAQPSQRGWCSVGRTKVHPLGSQAGRRRRHQRFDRAVAVGTTRPRLLGSGPSGPREDLRSSAIHQSVHRGVKPRFTSGPRKRPPAMPQSTASRHPGNTRDAGFRHDMSGWQKSVRDILAGNALRASEGKRACLARRKPPPS